MDEPLSNLDAKLRVETRANIAALQARLNTTTVYVTHDQVEAMTMGHRVALLKDGVLQQVDTPRNLYDRPKNAFVAGFIGSPAMNLRDVELVPGGAKIGDAVIPLSRDTMDTAAKANLRHVRLGIRPEALAVSDTGFAIQVTLVEELGSDSYVYGSLPEDNPAVDKPIVVRMEGRATPRIGDKITVSAGGGAEHVFDVDSGERIG